MIGAEGVVFVGALALGIGHWLGARTGAGMRRLWERAVLGREAYAAQLAEAQAEADDERRLREAAVDHMGAYVAQVKEGQQEIQALRAQLAEAQAEAAEARARVLLAWHEADQLEAMLNTAEDDLDAARRDRRQAEELAEELREGTERQLAEEVIAARFSGWLVEDQCRRYEARIARRASLSVSRRSAPSAVHGPEGGQCDDHQKKTVLQDGQGGACE